MHAYSSRARRSTLILFALLINLLILLLIFYPDVAYKSLQVVTPQHKPAEVIHISQDDDEIPAALNPRSSSFGTPTMPPPQDSSSAQEHDSQMQEEHDQHESEPVEEKNEAAEQMLPTDQHLESDKAPLAKQQPKRTAATETPRKIPQKRRPVPQETKKQLTLADITQGFIHQMQNEGNDTIKSNGDPNKLPTDAQLKRERYLARLIWCIQNTMQIHRRSINGIDKAENPMLLIALNKDGYLEDLRIIKTSNNRELDRFMLFIFKEASSSFPPVPHYLNHNGFRTFFTVIIQYDPDNPWKYGLHH